MSWIDWEAIGYFMRLCGFGGGILVVGSAVFYAFAWVVAWVRKHI